MPCCCDTILCCFGCIYCFGCRDILCRKIVFFPPPKLYNFDVELTPTTPRISKSVNNNNNVNSSPHLLSSTPRSSIDHQKISLFDSNNNDNNSLEMKSMIEPEQTMWLVDLEGNKVLPFKSKGFTAYKIKTSNHEVIAGYFIKQETYSYFYSNLIIHLVLYLQ